MEWLVYLTYLAGALLCLYLVIIIAVIGALFFGLGFGVRWGNRKLAGALTRANELAVKADGVVTRGMNALAEPEVRATAGAHAAEVFVKRLLGR